MIDRNPTSDPVIDAYRAFETLVLKAMGTQKSIVLGNVEFWVDAEGPWAGQLSYSCPTPRWVGVAEALTEALKSQIAMLQRVLTEQINGPKEQRSKLVPLPEGGYVAIPYGP